MDFTGSIIREFHTLPSSWWLWLIVAAGIGSVVSILCMKLRKQEMKIRAVVVTALLTVYVVFILFETVIGRKPGVRRFELIPFWSYGKAELVSEVLLNYILFIPFGVLMYLHTKRVWGSIITGVCLSGLIEVSQLIFSIGLFEFDDIIGNTIGCLIGIWGVTACGKVKKNGL